MANYKSYIEKGKSLLMFALPIIMGNLGQMLLGAGDVLVAARHGANTLASISIATAFINTVFLIGLGLLFSISPVLSKKRGEKTDISNLLKITLLYSLILSVIFGALGLSMIPLIPLLRFEESLVPHIQNYILICSFSFPFAFIWQALKEFLQAHEKVLFPNLASIVAILLNLVLNWLLVFGYGAIPSLGVSGLAVATFLIRLAMAASLVLYCGKYLKNAIHFDFKYLREVVRIGYPIALSLFLEMSAFSLVTVIAGQISIIQVAAHNIVLIFASITFMIPLAVSNALGVRVGYAYGEKNYRDIKENLYAGMIISMLIMSGFASLFFFIPESLMQFFSQDVEIIQTGAALLFIVALFQIFDGAQVTLSGALRGLGMTKPIMVTIFLGYWLIGLPVGAYLAFKLNLEVYGLWIGLAMALFMCAIIFSLILRKKLRTLRGFLVSPE